MVPLRAFVVVHDQGVDSAGALEVDEAAMLSDGDLAVDVEWSCCNYKDAMVALPGSRVARRSPLIGGVDAAGTVSGAAGGFAKGDPVIVHGRGLGTSHHGGFAPRLRCPAQWALRRPEGLDARTAMAYGTAGYTAMASVLALEGAGINPGDGEVMVTGASGGVGSVAVALLASRGHDVTAMSGKAAEHAYLERLGAARVVGRDDLADRPDRVLGGERLAGAIDCVGGTTLAAILRSLRWGGVAVATGLVGGSALETTVYPFITRNVALLGIDTVDAPNAIRASVWSALVGALPPATLDEMVTRTVGIGQVAEVLSMLARGEVAGRVLVDPLADQLA